MLAELPCPSTELLPNIHTDAHIDPPYSHGWVWVCLGSLTVMFVFCLIHQLLAKRKARAADESVNDTSPLAPGARFISGQAEFAEGLDRAVVVYVEQKGTETKGKQEWVHEWKESSRRVETAPFYVRRSTGERIRVEPGNDVLLVDEPDQMIWRETGRRTRLAVLGPGESVIVEGQLERGHDPEVREKGNYRSVAQGWVMRPPAKGPMQVSTEKLGDRHRKRAAQFKDAAWALVWIGFFANLTLMYYQTSLWFGQDTCARVDRKDTYTTMHKGKATLHYRIKLRIRDEQEAIIERDVGREDWDKLDEKMFVAVRDVPSWRTAAQPGKDVSVHPLAVVLNVIAVIFGIGAYASALLYRAWYEGRLDDSGRGRLPEPPATTPS